MQDDIVKEHYQKESVFLDGLNNSTMKDKIVLQKEVEFISEFIKISNPQRVLDLGCGNGYTLNIVGQKYPSIKFYGTDFVDELLYIAKKINLPNCDIQKNDVRQLLIGNNNFDLVYTERCLINILDWEEQKKVLSEIYRVLKLGGYYLMIECFTDGLQNYNKAREEIGLVPLKEAYHNKYFNKEQFMNEIKDKFTIINSNWGDLFPYNFLSSHYFISRVLHEAITKNGKFIRNSEFVKYFSFLSPQGNYSPIQAFILKKVGE